MQKRALRLTLLALLLLIGIGASYVIWDVQERLDTLFDSDRDLEARGALWGMSAALGELREAEGGARVAERKALIVEAAKIAGGMAALWLVGLVLLARLPRQEMRPTAAAVAPPPAPAGFAAEAAPEPPVRLSEAAAVCTAISRISDARALPDVLARAASVIDAAGNLLWFCGGGKFV